MISPWDWFFLGSGGAEGSPSHDLVAALTLDLLSDEAEQVWVWEYETEEGAHDLYMDTGEEIRFRVVDESFVDTSPTGPSSADATTSSEELPKKEAPYTLVVSGPDGAEATMEAGEPECRVGGCVLWVLLWDLPQQVRDPVGGALAGHFSLESLSFCRPGL